MDAPPERTPAESAAREKRWVALTSVVAAVLLTILKVVVGFATGSIGILSEAAHSGLDLVAAVVTYLAVRISGRPADPEHNYGHGKIENLSALFETLLLLGTCVWIVIEASKRLFGETVEVDASVWGFAVMIVSIVVNVSRTRALARVARKYGSQALEADALHFRTDIWSSWVVLAGLGFVLLGKTAEIPELAIGDPLAALGVACIVVWVSYKLGRKTIADLLDEVPQGLRDEVRSALAVAGGATVHRVRVRRSGPEAFVDATLCVDPGTSVERAHEIAETAESAVRKSLPGADVTIHVEPGTPGKEAAGESLPSRVRRIASRVAMGAHDVRLLDVLGRRRLELHLEVSDRLNVGSAHEVATAFEAEIRAIEPGLDRVVTHIEPALEVAKPKALCPPAEDAVADVVRRLAREQDARCTPHEIEVRRVDDELQVSLHCTLSAETGIVDAHDFTERLERTLAERVPGLKRAVIHVEPPEGRADAPKP